MARTTANATEATSKSSDATIILLVRLVSAKESQQPGGDANVGVDIVFVVVVVAVAIAVVAVVLVVVLVAVGLSVVRISFFAEDLRWLFLSIILPMLLNKSIKKNKKNLQWK